MYKMYPDIFVITSVINTGNTPWSYTGIRSCYTKEDRCKQTIQTIDSIRTALNGNAKILLVECSDLDESTTNTLKDKVDYFLQTYDDMSVRDACINSSKKGFGEVKKLQKACEFIQQNDIKFNRLFKISGRYFLTSSFDNKIYDEISHFTFKMNDNNRDGITVLYSVPYSLFHTYVEKLEECNKIYMNGPPISVESLIPCMCNPKKNISTLGVAGYLGVFNENGISEYYTA
jgi:hypothetical protein